MRTSSRRTEIMKFKSFIPFERHATFLGFLEARIAAANCWRIEAKARRNALALGKRYWKRRSEVLSAERVALGINAKEFTSFLFRTTMHALQAVYVLICGLKTSFRPVR
ncbi:hypothetical protein HYPSUDRAFT_254611 [Hypholoma sublateritium FD-334 SS-4]|uniref:Uncharacterized protein n=1 Tax=Hypholoma sublateritium (strain FD-334 SS-4) TaxID=945553 RepID=A0A0D2PPE1_HYPSF|nr:hypothetical protein HYPSUDRAFT_254611 [Hypholoma sublateritium FD-334 SS-4]